MKEENEVLRGSIEAIVFHSDDTDYTVLDLALEDGTLMSAVGTMPLPAEGETVVLYGHYTIHPEYGKQFAFLSFEKQLPADTDGILKFLCSRAVRGVGPVSAEKIVRKFGTDTFEVMENHPEWLADISGITMKKAAEISRSFREQTGLRGVMVFCSGYLSMGEVTRVYKRFGPGAVGLLEQDPYVLCTDVGGIPFDKVDALARSLGAAPDGSRRIYCGLRYCLSFNANTNGHTCLPEGKLIAAGAALLELPEERVRTALADLLAAGQLAGYEKGGVRYVLRKEDAAAEEHIAERLAMLDRSHDTYRGSDIALLIEKTQRSLGMEYAALQREALFAALENGVMILTGGPGTGKTTVVKAMLNLFCGMREKVVLCAPTGRAAKRLSETTGADAKTLHRALEMERTVENEPKFNRHENNPLEERVVIVDEASMIDLRLMEALVRALRPDARLILIGDAGQLPSVGAGNVLSDLIGSGCIRTVCLNEIFRQSRESLIVTNAHRIHKGEMPRLDCTDSDFFFVRRENDRQIPDTIADLITHRLPAAYGRDITDKIQVITPSRKGSGGVEQMNQRLQQAVNPPGPGKKEKHYRGVIFREGDKVMQNTNNYELEWKRDDGTEGMGIFNGDIGVILHVNPEGQTLQVRFDDRTVVYEFSLLDELELAYAITVHKSQGSEYPVVILPTYRCPPMLMTRNLFYTALTRARRMVVLVGMTEPVRIMVENNREILRYTTLSDRIKRYF